MKLYYAICISLSALCHTYQAKQNPYSAPCVTASVTRWKPTNIATMIGGISLGSFVVYKVVSSMRVRLYLGEKLLLIPTETDKRISLDPLPRKVVYGYLKRYTKLPSNIINKIIKYLSLLTYQQIIAFNRLPGKTLQLPRATLLSDIDKESVLFFRFRFSSRLPWYHIIEYVHILSKKCLSPIVSSNSRNYGQVVHLNLTDIMVCQKEEDELKLCSSCCVMFKTTPDNKIILRTIEAPMYEDNRGNKRWYVDIFTDNREELSKKRIIMVKSRDSQYKLEKTARCYFDPNQEKWIERVST